MLNKVTTTLIAGTHWILPQGDGLRAFKQKGVDLALAKKQKRIYATWATVEFAEAKLEFAAAASAMLLAWQKAERSDLTVKPDGYPFELPIDEMVTKIQDWTGRTSVEAR